MKLFFFPHRRQIIMLLCITSRGASQMQRRIAQNAWRHFRSQRLLEAEQACVEALREEQNDRSLLHLLAVLRERQGRYSEAAQLLRKAIATSPTSAELHNNLGMVLGELGQLEESVTVLAQSIRLRPGYARAYRNLGLSLTWLGRMDVAWMRLCGLFARRS